VCVWVLCVCVCVWCVCMCVVCVCVCVRYTLRKKAFIIFDTVYTVKCTLCHVGFPIYLYFLPKVIVTVLALY